MLNGIIYVIFLSFVMQGAYVTFVPCIRASWASVCVTLAIFQLGYIIDG